MKAQTSYDPNRHNTLMIVRVIWAMLVVGQVGFGLVACFIVLNQEADSESQLRGQMFAIASGLLIGAVGLGYYFRNQSYKKHWEAYSVAPAGYFQGNLVLLVALEGVSLLTLVFVIEGGQIFPLILPAVASLAVQCVNFPSGVPMETATPDMVRESP